MSEGYCMKCKAKRDMKSTSEVTMKNGRKAMKGECSKCSTKMFKILAGPKKGKGVVGAGSKRARKPRKLRKLRRVRKVRRVKNINMYKF